MGLTHRDYLSGGRVFGCHVCRTHLSTVECIMSRQFHGQHGRAWLFSSVVNIIEGVPEDRNMTTGLHTVKDITCSKCGTLLGWKYEKAFALDQKYKEGKYILEKSMMTDVE